MKMEVGKRVVPPQVKQHGEPPEARTSEEWSPSQSLRRKWDSVNSLLDFEVSRI